jgi:hypothetical protein
MAEAIHAAHTVLEHVGNEHVSLYANALFGFQLTIWAGGYTWHHVVILVRFVRAKVSRS